MNLGGDFDDSKQQVQHEYQPYHYDEENNESWAGALPVKQYVSAS